jgi:hypothetical protein
MSSSFARGRVTVVVWLTALIVGVTAAASSAETLMMPNREMLMGASEVVWGITTLPNGSTYDINFGDGTAHAAGPVADRSYIAVNHTYALSGTFTATLTVQNGVTTEAATVQILVYNGAVISAFDLRNLKTNKAIQDGLRYLWMSQGDRAGFDLNPTTSFGGFAAASTALAVLAFENHGYRLPNGNASPVGIYPKYAVRRGLNAVVESLQELAIGLTPQGDDPCVSVPAPVCTALNTGNFDEGYTNAIAILPLAASGALTRTITEVGGPLVLNHTIGEILQRMVNATTWGQNDSQIEDGGGGEEGVEGDGGGDAAVAALVPNPGRGGWYYSFNQNSSDGSINGWNILALLDAAGAGANVPPWVKTEWAFALANGLNDNGSYDYQADGDRAFDNAVNVAKTGVGIQGMFFAGRINTDADLVNAQAWLGARWNNQPGGQDFQCFNGTYNKGCAYGMYNVFKGLRLYAVGTLTGVNRPAGPGGLAADDWYADSVDWLVANQSNPTSQNGGQWAGGPGQLNLVFSSISDDEASSAALALLILSPTALVLPDETLFSTVGLQHGSPLTIGPLSNPVTNPAGTHTVTATTSASNGNPIPGITVTFRVTGGPNNGATGSGTTGASGQTTFTYTDTGGAGADSIQAFVGALSSNIVVQSWVVVFLRCDANNDGVITQADLNIIRAANGQLASGPNDARDGNNDGRINVADVRYCQVRLTPP